MLGNLPSNVLKKFVYIALRSGIGFCLQSWIYRLFSRRTILHSLVKVKMTKQANVFIKCVNQDQLPLSHWWIFALLEKKTIYLINFAVSVTSISNMFNIVLRTMNDKFPNEQRLPELSDAHCMDNMEIANSNLRSIAW